jgi:hypothetical protein
MQLRKLTSLALFLMCFLLGSAFAQQKTVLIIGRVIDEFNRPIADVHVLNTQNRIGKITDKYGQLM